MGIITTMFKVVMNIGGDKTFEMSGTYHHSKKYISSLSLLNPKFNFKQYCYISQYTIHAMIFSLRYSQQSGKVNSSGCV